MQTQFRASAELTETEPASVQTRPPVRLTPDVNILGVRFHSLTMSETIRTLNRFIAQKEPRQICLSNAYTVALCQKDGNLMASLNKSDLVLADGMSIVWGARWIHQRIPERVAGTDLMEALCAEAEKMVYRVYLLGSSTENLKALKTILLGRWPKLVIAGDYSPPMCDLFTEEENHRIIAQLERARPDILFVGLSCPKQEKWISQNLGRLPVSLALGVGAAFDFISGKIPRAPGKIQRIGLEWLYRLYREPRRLWKRYLLGNAVFLSLLLKERIKPGHRSVA